MKKKFVLIVLQFLLFFTFNTYSQDSIIHKHTQKYFYNVKINSHTNNNQAISNYFIHEISKSIPKDSILPHYTFYYKQKIIIKKINSNIYKIIIELNNKTCSGNAAYKGFNISDVLIPSKADFKVNILQQNNKFYKIYTFKKIGLNKENQRIAAFTFEDTIPDTDFKVWIDNKNFYYDNSDKKRFDDRIMFINNYYAAKSIIDSAFDKIQLIDLKNYDKIPLYFIKLDEIERIIKYLDNKHFSQKLNLENFDPISFINKLYDLKIQKNQLNSNLNETLKNIKHINYNKDLKTLSDEYVQNVVSYFYKSRQVSALYTSLFYNLTKINYNKEYIANTEKTVNKILSKIYSDTDPDFNKLLKKFEKNIYKSYISKAEEFINNGSYNQALIILSNDKSFCKAANINCSKNIFKDIALAKYGIYYSYLKVAKKAVQIDSLDLAEDYVYKAIDYQHSNCDYINSNINIKQIFKQIQNLYIQKGEQEIRAQNYYTAYKYFNKALEINKSKNDINVSNSLNQGLKLAKQGIYKDFLIKAENYLNDNDNEDAKKYINKALEFQKSNKKEITNNNDAINLLSKIKHQYYLKLIEEGEQLLNTEKFKDALSKLEKAKKIESKYDFVIDEKLDFLIKKTEKPILLNEIKTGNIKAWGNELDQAWKILNNSINSQKKYMLAYDNDVNKALKYLKDKIYLKKCQNTKDEYEENCLMSQKNINTKNFIKAEAYLKAADKIVSENSLCNISDKYAKETLQKYSQAVRFQKKIKEIKQNLANDNFTQLLYNYKKTENYYYDNQIKRFNIKYVPLFNFIASSNNPKFIEYSVSYYIQQKKYLKSFRLLKIIKKRNYYINRMQYFQCILGEEIAIKDYNEYPKNNPKSNIFKYTNDDKWFKSFKKSYLKSWKEAEAQKSGKRLFNITKLLKNIKKQFKNTIIQFVNIVNKIKI